MSEYPVFTKVHCWMEDEEKPHEYIMLEEDFPDFMEDLNQFFSWRRMVVWELSRNPLAVRKGMGISVHLWECTGEREILPGQ